MSKFKVGDIVKGVHDDVRGDIMKIEEITPEGWFYLSCLNIGERRKSHCDLGDDLILRRRANRENSIVLFNEYYLDTYVEVTNQEEYNKAMLFYENKGYSISEYKERKYIGTYYFEWFDSGFFGLRSSCPVNGTINITNDVLGDNIKIHIDKARAGGDVSESFNYLKYIESINDGKSSQPVQKNNKHFINLPKKIMNTLRTIMFNELDLKKLAKLVETTEKKLEPINDLIERLVSLRDVTEEEIKELEYSVEQQNKKGIEIAKKHIEEQNEVLDDKLTEQLITVGEKLFK